MTMHNSPHICLSVHRVRESFKGIIYCGLSTCCLWCAFEPFPGPFWQCTLHAQWTLSKYNRTGEQTRELFLILFKIHNLKLIDQQNTLKGQVNSYLVREFFCALYNVLCSTSIFVGVSHLFNCFLTYPTRCWNVFLNKKKKFKWV